MRASKIDEESERVQEIARRICAHPVDFYPSALPDEVYFYEQHIIVVLDGVWLISRTDTKAYFEFLKYTKTGRRTLDISDAFRLNVEVYYKDRMPELRGPEYDLE